MNLGLLFSQSLVDMLIVPMIILALVVEIMFIIIFLRDIYIHRKDSISGKGVASCECQLPENINELFNNFKNIINEIYKNNKEFINIMLELMDSIKNILIYRELSRKLENNLKDIINELNKEIKPGIEYVKTRITCLDKLTLRAILATYFMAGKKLAYTLLQLISSEENLPENVKKLISELNEQAKSLGGKEKNQSGDLWTLALKVEIYTVLKTLSAGDQTTGEKPLLGLIDRNALSALEEGLKRDLEKACNTKIKKLDANELGKLLLLNCSGENRMGLGGSTPSGSSKP